MLSNSLFTSGFRKAKSAKKEKPIAVSPKYNNKISDIIRNNKLNNHKTDFTNNVMIFILKTFL
jgi:hypothetical protein